MSKKIIVLLLSLFLSSTLMSQTGKISGVVTDKANNDVLPGVNVIVDGTTVGSSTDVDGFYVVYNAPVGKHTVRFSYVGYKDVAVQGVIVNIDNTTELNAQMEEAVGEGDIVVVTAVRELIKKKETNTRHITTSDQIKNMPVTSVQDIVSLGSGLVKSANSNSIYARGGRVEQTAIVLDGVTQNNPYSGVTNSDVNANAIEEVTAQTGGFDAEYGRVMSGIVQVTTKTGSDKYKFTSELSTDDFGGDIFGINSQGYGRYNINIGGPLLPSMKDYTFFISLDYKNEDDPAPRFNVEGPRPTNRQVTRNLTGSLKGQLTENINFKLSGNYNKIDNQVYSQFRNFFGPANHHDYQEFETASGALQFTHTLDKATYYTVKGSYFQEIFKSGDNQLWDNFRAYGNSPLHVGAGTNPGLFAENSSSPTGLNMGSRVLAVESYNGSDLKTFIVAPTNHVFNQWINRFQTSMDFAVDFNTVLDRHNIKGGVSYKKSLIRRYVLNPRGLWSSSTSQYADDRAFSDRYDAYYGQSVGFGFDIFGNWAEDGNFSDNKNGAEAPKEPVEMAFYVKDVVEFDDFVLNFGLRVDQFNPNDWQFKNFNDPIAVTVANEGTQEGLSESDLVASDVHTIVQPRLGFSFPVSDFTKFSAQFGKFAQMPTYNQLFASRRDFRQRLIEAELYYQGATSFLANPNLKPSSTTSYELAVHHQIADDMVMSVTAYYKEITDLIQNTYVDLGANYGQIDMIVPLNVDYSNTKGIDLSFSTRRISNFLLSANYSLSYATGTGSTVGTSNNIVNINGANGQLPRFETFLNFDQRHTGSFNVDYRFSEDEGPEIFGTKLLENFGANVIYRFNSGRPYTGRVIVDPWAGRGVETAAPTSNINELRTPFTSYLDLRLDKTISLDIGENKLGVNFYVQIMNLLNTENWEAVHRGTGRPDDSGYLESAKNVSYTTDAQIAAFKWRDNNPANFGQPRQIRFGLKLDF